MRWVRVHRQTMIKQSGRGVGPCHAVAARLAGERPPLRARRQRAAQQEVRAVHHVAVLGEVLDGVPAVQQPPRVRGLHPSTFRLNVSAFCGIGGCSGDVHGVFGAW